MLFFLALRASDLHLALFFTQPGKSINVMSAANNMLFIWQQFNDGGEFSPERNKPVHVSWCRSFCGGLLHREMRIILSHFLYLFVILFTAWLCLNAGSDRDTCKQGKQQRKYN